MMKDVKRNSAVFFARGYEEAKDIELSQDNVTLKSMVLRFFIIVWVSVVNILLWFLKHIFFQNNTHFQSVVKNIAVYTVGTLGDNVLLLPAIAALKKRFIEARVTAITNCDGFSDYPSKEILGNSPFVDRLITLSNHPVQRRGFQIVVDAPEAKGLKCDLFINLSPFGNRGWTGAVIREMLFARWLKAKWAVGFKMSTYSRKHIFDKVQHHFMKNEARRQRDVLEEIGIKPVENEDLLTHDTKAQEKVKSILKNYGVEKQNIVLLNPGAKLKASHWPAERFGKVALWLKEKNHYLIFINGTGPERELCENVVRASEGSAINLSGVLGIQDLTELLRMSVLLVTNSTGPMTLAAMTRTPMVVISSTRFSPTFYIPYGDKMIWLFSFTENSYSYNDEGGPSEDLLNIQVNNVISAIEKLAPSKPADRENKI